MSSPIGKEQEAWPGSMIRLGARALGMAGIRQVTIALGLGLVASLCVVAAPVFLQQVVEELASPVPGQISGSYVWREFLGVNPRH